MPGRYYGYYYYDPTYMLIVISALISLFAQFLVNSRFSKYSRVRSRSGMTGAQAAERILQLQGIYDVAIHAAVEAIQLAAMVKKYERSQRHDWPGGWVPDYGTGPEPLKKKGGETV